MQLCILWFWYWGLVYNNVALLMPQYYLITKYQYAAELYQVVLLPDAAFTTGIPMPPPLYPVKAAIVTVLQHILQQAIYLKCKFCLEIHPGILSLLCVTRFAKKASHPIY